MRGVSQVQRDAKGIQENMPLEVNVPLPQMAGGTALYFGEATDAPFEQLPQNGLE